MLIVRRIWRAVTIAVLIALTVSVPLFWMWSRKRDVDLLQGSQIVSTARADIEVAAERDPSVDRVEVGYGVRGGVYGGGMYSP